MTGCSTCLRRPRRPAGSAAASRGNTLASAPLAVRMRPRSLDELVGQEHLLAPGSPLRQMVEADEPLTILLWGPPGTGKTTIATSAQRAHRTPVRRAVGRLGRRQGGPRDDRGRPARPGAAAASRPSCSSTRSTASPRPSRTPCCPASRTAGCRSSPRRPRTRTSASSRRCCRRSLLLTLEPLTDDDIGVLVDRALTDERGLGGSVTLDRRGQGATSYASPAATAVGR